MLRWITAVTVVLCLAVPAAAVELARVITWDDLIPPAPALVDPFTRLPPAQGDALRLVGTARYMEKLGQLQEDSITRQDAEEAAAELTRQGVDIDGMLADYDVYREKILAQRDRLNEDLDGRMVRLPGYLLPLEFTGTAVTEFLLVPYVGACIHVPPPPVNQMVHVRLDGSFTTTGLYEPVWVTGRMSAARSSQKLSLVDGSSNVDVGYLLEQSSVKPYVN